MFERIPKACISFLSEKAEVDFFQVDYVINKMHLIWLSQDSQVIGDISMEYITPAKCDAIGTSLLFTHKCCSRDQIDQIVLKVSRAFAC